MAQKQYMDNYSCYIIYHHLGVIISYLSTTRVVLLQRANNPHDQNVIAVRTFAGKIINQF